MIWGLVAGLVITIAYGMAVLADRREIPTSADPDWDRQPYD